MPKDKSKESYSRGQGWPVWFLVAIVIVIVYFVIDRGSKPEEDAVSLNDILKQDQAPDSNQEDITQAEESSEPVITPAERIPQPPRPAVAEQPQVIPVSEAVTPPPANPPAEKTSQVVKSTAPAVLPPNKLTQSSRPLTIQVASYKDAAMAKDFAAKVNKNGFSAYVLEKDLKEKGRVYRICVGEYSTKDQADGDLAKLKKKYKESFIIAK